MQLEADMYATDKSWKLTFAYFSYLEILNKNSGIYSKFNWRYTGNNCNILIRKLDWVSSSLSTVFGGLLLSRNPVSSALYVACGFTVNPKSASQFKINPVKIMEYPFIHCCCPYFRMFFRCPQR